MNFKKALGVTTGESQNSREDLLRYINLKLTALGCPAFRKGEYANLGVAEDLILNYRERNRLFKNAYCPADQRIQNF